MKKGVKRFFLLGLAVAASAAAGVAINRNKETLKKAVDDLVKKGKLTANEGKQLFNELLDELKKQHRKLERKIKSTTKKSVTKVKRAAKKATKKATKVVKKTAKKLK